MAHARCKRDAEKHTWKKQSRCVSTPAQYTVWVSPTHRKQSNQSRNSMPHPGFDPLVLSLKRARRISLASPNIKTNRQPRRNRQSEGCKEWRGLHVGFPAGPVNNKKSQSDKMRIRSTSFVSNQLTIQKDSDYDSRPTDKICSLFPLDSPPLDIHHSD